MRPVTVTFAVTGDKGREAARGKGLVWVVVRAAMVMATVLGLAWVAVAPCQGNGLLMDGEVYRAEVGTEVALYRAAVDLAGVSVAAVEMAPDQGGHSLGPV